MGTVFRVCSFCLSFLTPSPCVLFPARRALVPAWEEGGRPRGMGEPGGAVMEESLPGALAWGSGCEQERSPMQRGFGSPIPWLSYDGAVFFDLELQWPRPSAWRDGFPPTGLFLTLLSQDTWFPRAGVTDPGERGFRVVWK